MEDKSELVTEQRRQAILAEVESWRQGLPKGETWHGKLNNFHHYLPNPWSKTGSGRTDQASKFGLIDKSHGKIILEDDTSRKLKLYSDLFLSQTPREFFESIMSAVRKASEVHVSEIKHLQQKHYRYAQNLIWWRSMSIEEERKDDEKLSKAIEAGHALYEYVLPVYIELRVMGYSHYDLTG